MKVNKKTMNAAPKSSTYTYKIIDSPVLIWLNNSRIMNNDLCEQQIYAKL